MQQSFARESWADRAGGKRPNRPKWAQSRENDSAMMPIEYFQSLSEKQITRKWKTNGHLLFIELLNLQYLPFAR